MHVPEGGASTDYLRMTPVKTSAYHSLEGNKASAPRCESQESRDSIAVIPNQDGFNRSLAKSKKETSQNNPLHEVSSSLVHTQPQLRSQDNEDIFDDGPVKLKQYLDHTTNLGGRRDSANKSSTDCEFDDECSLNNRHSDDRDVRAAGKYEDIFEYPNRQDYKSTPKWIARTNLPFHYTTSTNLGNDPTGSKAQSSSGSVYHAYSSFNHTESQPQETWNSERPFTSSLGVPRVWDHGTSPELSIISDAGDQQQLRQKRTFLSPQDTFDEDYDLEQSLASLPPLGSKHELQEQIMAARERTKNNEGQIRRFIPKEVLCRVINTESVAKELTKELSQVHSREKIRSYARQVCKEVETKEIRRGKAKIKSFRKIFALLVLVEAASSLPLFIEEDVSDQDLPLTLVRYQGTDEFYRKGDQSKTPLSCFKHEKWSPVKLENFQEYQWLLLAPFFSPDEDGDVKHYILQDEHILPFVASNDADAPVADKTGGYGKVIMVHIHSDHHNFRDRELCERGFAIKQQLHDHDREAFKKEIAILMKFSGERSHRHVVSLLATYEQFRKFHLIFYRAGGDLSDYWNMIMPRPDVQHSNVLWVAEQCTGIAEGLSKLHKLLSITKRHIDTEEGELDDFMDNANQSAGQSGKRVRIILPLRERVGTDSSLLSNGVKERAASPIKMSDQHGEEYVTFGHRFRHDDEDDHLKQYGRHGDIHPGNILWYDDNPDDGRLLKGTLKIADFGQAELNSKKSKTKRRSVANMLTYRPPECDLQPSVIRQSYDIWCLGCVYLEFLTWLLGGSRLYHIFTRKRLTPDVFQYNQKSDTFFQVVRNQETQHPEFMIKPEVTQFIDELHQHPKCTAYIHEFLNIIQNDMLVVESSDRRSCAGIWNSLGEMSRKCRNDEDYAATSNPWCIAKTPVPRSVELDMTHDAEQVIQKNLPPNLVGPTSVTPTPAPAVQPVAPRKRRPSRIPRPRAR